MINHFKLKIYDASVTCTVDHVHDGDTFCVSIPYWPAVAGQNIDVRIFGIDAPELHDIRPDIKAIADQAKDLLTQLIDKKEVTLKNLRRDKYFRILAEVYLGEDLIADKLLAANLVRPYDGKKKPW